MTAVRSYQNDRNYGFQKEAEVIDLIKETFCESLGESDIVNTRDLYNTDYYPYDYEGSTNKTIFEMKSRRNKKTQYPTTIIPCHKINPDNRRQIFIFNFTDACCYIEYNKELFDSFNKRMITTQRFGKVDIPKNHYEIPVHLLIDMLRVYKVDN